MHTPLSGSSSAILSCEPEKSSHISFGEAVPSSVHSYLNNFMSIVFVSSHGCERFELLGGLLLYATAAQ